MKKAKNLTVKVIYKVELGDVEMPEEVYDQLVEANNNYDEIDANATDYAEAAGWLQNKITEGDAMEWTAEIEDID